MGSRTAAAASGTLLIQSEAPLPQPVTANDPQPRESSFSSSANSACPENSMTAPVGLAPNSTGKLKLESFLTALKFAHCARPSYTQRYPLAAFGCWREPEQWTGSGLGL